MTYKMMQMVLRGFTLTLMALGFFCNSERVYLSRIDGFIVLGICGSYTVITLGLLLEAGLQLNSDKVVEASLLAGGIALTLLSAVLSFTNLLMSPGYTPADRPVVNNSAVSTIAVIMFTLDLYLLLH